MSLTIIEVLENAEYNLKRDVLPIRKIGLDQLRNAIDLLEAGSSPFEDFDQKKLEDIRKNK